MARRSFWKRSAKMGKTITIFVVVVTLLAFSGFAVWQTQPQVFKPMIERIDSITPDSEGITDINIANSVVGSKTLNDYEKEAHELINRERIRYGLEPLIWNDDLAAAARQHSRDMANTGIFNHGTRYCHGENIVMSTDWMYPAHAVKTWMESYGHKQNILRESFTEGGIGIARSDSGATYYTQNFAIDSRQC